MDGFVEKKLKVREYLQRFSLFLYKVEEFHKLKKLNDQEYHHLLSLSPFDSCSLNNEYLQSYVLLPFEQEFLKVNCTRNANNEIIDMQPWYVDYMIKMWSRIHEVKTDSERTKLYFYQKSDEEALYSDIVELLNNDLIEKKNTLKESKLKP